MGDFYVHWQFNPLGLEEYYSKDWGYAFSRTSNS